MIMPVESIAEEGEEEAALLLEAVQQEGETKLAARGFWAHVHGFGEWEKGL